MGEKVTIMVLKVDLQCPHCYKKIKKVLCKFPQIRNEIYDEKQNTVTITVVCCSPEKIRDKLCCKGGKTIKSIEIKPPPKPKEPEKPKEKPKEPEKPKPKEPEEKPKEPEKPKEKPAKPIEPEKPKPKEPEGKPSAPLPAPAPAPAPTPTPTPAPKPPEPVPGYPPVIPVGVCCMSCYEGHDGGPCYEGYGRPVPCYDNYGYVPPYGPYGGNRGGCYTISRCDNYFSEENTSGCTIM